MVAVPGRFVTLVQGDQTPAWRFRLCLAQAPQALRLCPSVPVPTPPSDWVSQLTVLACPPFLHTCPLPDQLLKGPERWGGLSLPAES